MRRYAVLLSLVLAFSTTTWGYNISDVTISPWSPTTTTPVSVTVTGNAPATNYYLDQANLWQLGNMFFLDMSWTRAGIGGMALVPYTHEESLGTLAEGKYVVYVRSFCDSLMRDSKSVSFTVSKATGIDPSLWPGLFWYSSWWIGLNGSTSLIQIHALIWGPSEVSLDLSLTHPVSLGL
jgi:hypothetical protein